MPLSPKLPTADLSPALLQEISRVAALPAVRGAFADFLSHEAQLAEWQQQLAKIPAPPFGEQLRSEWMLERFLELGLEQVRTDEAANVFGIRPATGNRYVALSAHIDTVFPAGTPLNVRQQGSRLYGPGVSDNAAGVVAMLGIAAAISRSRVRHTAPILFVANVGEEGEGDLRGMRHIFADRHWLDSIAFNLVLDGAGNDTIVAEALGSRRFEVIVRGPGGHSWSDFGTPNPIVVLARAIESFRQTPLPVSPKTTFNIGVIRGGTSVNSIPESASMRVDIRSTSTAEIERLERALRLGLDTAVADETKGMSQSAKARALGLSAEIVTIGNRPGGELPPEARILQVIRSVDAYLGNVAQVQRASTDANIPLSLGREAIAIGGGGTGGGAHTLQEWFDCTGRDFGLKRILLTLLALTGVSE
ncbi:MAG TPA: M20/M25/M40 family metallo-hydrolase [Terriglobales bacterium]|jgi:tripeptide aminopeptidase|nr:M20/M25/M40 family metallo-hydrolase [Terriglobales bacterium]